MTTTAEARGLGAAAPTAAVGRSIWLDSVLGIAVFAVVLFHVWSWVLEPLATDYWEPAATGWASLDSHLGIRMPLLLLISGGLASRAIRSGIRAPEVHLRIATHYYLYVVGLGVLALLSFTLPAGDLPHRLQNVGDALSQLLVPDTPLWYVMALALYPLLLALVAPAPRWLVLSALTVCCVTSGMYETPGMWHRLLALMIFFAIGAYFWDALRVLEARATLPRILGLLVLGVAATEWYVRISPDSLLAGVLDFGRLVGLGLAALLIIAFLVRSRRFAAVGSFLGRRTLQIYITHIVLLWILILILDRSPGILGLLESPVAAVVAPLVVAALVTAVALAVRPVLEHLGYLFAMPPDWRTGVLDWQGGGGQPAAAASWTPAPEAVPMPMPVPVQIAAAPAVRPPCSVVVVAYNCSALLSEQLPEVDWASAGARLVIVDNSDDPVERRQTQTMCDWYGWDYLPQHRNAGFGAAANAGADYAIAAGSTSILFLNPDAWLTAETVSLLARHCTERPDTAFSTTIYRPDRQPWFTGGTLDLSTGRTSGRIDRAGGTLRWLSGAVLAMSADLWRRVGGFDSGFFLYWEDVDLCWRIRRAGGALEVLSDAEAFHYVGATQQAGRKPASYVYYNTRNRLWFAARHLSPHERRPWLRATARLSWELIGMAGRTPAAFWAALRGAWAGWRALRRAPIRDGAGGPDLSIAEPAPLVTTGGT